MPVFCDIDPETHNIDPYCAEKMITPRTTGIIGVHLWGRPCDVDALTDLAERHNLRLLFDAAHAFACSHGGQMVGGFGDAEVFSFHATKFFNTYEGGAVATNDDDLATKIRLMKNFGFSGYDSVVHIGTNGKMSEVSAAMGLTSLEALDEFVDTNHTNYRLYLQQLHGIPGMRLLPYDERERCNYQYIVVEVDEAVTIVDRDSLVEILQAENVLARRYYFPGCHRMEPYRSLFPHAGLLLPNTERLVTRIMCLPTGTAVGESEIRQICQVLCLVVENGSEVRRRMQALRTQGSDTAQGHLHH
jgi:dTDP-4-amino-4,6-dideoxygalactose transaminase